MIQILRCTVEAIGCEAPFRFSIHPVFLGVSLCISLKVLTESSQYIQAGLKMPFKVATFYANLGMFMPNTSLITL